MIYPTIVLVFASVVLTGMLLFLVPIFSKIFAHLGGQLPMLTQEVVNASNFLRHDWYHPLFGPRDDLRLQKWRKTEHGKRNWDRVKLRLPMKIGATIRKIAMARFARSLSTLVAAGVDIITAIEITADVRQLGRRVGAARRAPEGARRRLDLAAARREPRLPADGVADDQGRRGDRRARQDARQDRRTSTRKRSTPRSRRSRASSSR